MRCKVGDLAISVRARMPENVGLVCLIVAAAYSDEDGHRWFVEHPRPRMLGTRDGTPVLESCTGIFPDEWLRPLRDNDGEDETLSWASLPHKEPA